MNAYSHRSGEQITRSTHLIASPKRWFLSSIVFHSDICDLRRTSINQSSSEIIEITEISKLLSLRHALTGLKGYFSSFFLVFLVARLYLQSGPLMSVTRKWVNRLFEWNFWNIPTMRYAYIVTSHCNRKTSVLYFHYQNESSILTKTRKQILASGMSALHRNNNNNNTKTKIPPFTQKLNEFRIANERFAVETHVNTPVC